MTMLAALAAAPCGAQTSGTAAAASVPPPGQYADIEIRAGATPSTAAVGKPGGNLTVSSFGEGPKTFNPITSNDSASNDILNLAYSSLVTLNGETQKLEAGLAESVTIDPTSTTVWLIKLKPEITWSDGKPLTADDVLFTVEAIKDTRYLCAIRDVLKVDGKTPEFEKIDDLTVRVTTARATGFMASLLAFPIVPKHAYAGILKDGTFDSALTADAAPEKLVTSGPFRVKVRQAGERVVMERNPKYFRRDAKGQPLPYLDTLTFSYAGNIDTMTLRFQAGETDALESPPMPSIAKLREEAAAKNYTLHDAGPTNGSSLMWFNLKDGVGKGGKPYVDPAKLKMFSDPRFRKAVLHSINREGIIRAELRGLAQVGTTPLESPANKIWYNSDTPTYAFDRAKAKALLDEMGLKLKDGEKVRTDAAGNKVAFTITTNKGNTTREKIAGLLVSDLRAVGIEARPDFISFNSLTTITDSTYEFEAMLLGLTGGGVDPVGKMNSYISSGRTNLYNPKQEKPFIPWAAEIDRLAIETVASLKFDDQKKNYGAMQRILSEQLPVLPMWHSRVFVAVSNKYGNIKPTALDPHLLWNADEIFVK